MIDTAQPSRRQFLGVLGIVMLGPAIPMAADHPSSGPVYLGPVRDLVEGVPLERGWALGFDMLVESVEMPQSGQLTVAGSIVMKPHWPLGERLRSRGVLRACEADFFCNDETGQRASAYGVEVTLLESARRCEAAWKRLDAAPPEAGYAPCEGIGDAAVVSRGGWSLPGKIFFRRANAFCSVVPFTPEQDARPLASKLDRRVIESAR